ncbi:MAG: UvrD-helicase domain-containing protein [Phycisphaeraceae bacterium]|nr:UvrD-helicase domain-containing protein [Phycisphaeraceae bacterium]
MNDGSAFTTDRPSKLLEGLNEPQRQAVAHVDGPLLVLAGAGSGKTRVITRRIAHLVHEVGIPPWQVLAITFTNKAAGEMRQRVEQLLGPRDARRTTVCTFHSLCARLLRQYADRLGISPGFSIYDTADQKRAVKQALTDLEISASHFPPDRVLGVISQAKNDLIEPEAFAARAGDFFARHTAKIYKQYQKILLENAAVDFDDLLMLTVQLLKQPESLAELQQRFMYLLIDEYQDTNHAQFMLAHALASRHRNLCVTGDPDQSIYRWRGADIRNILDFQQHYPDATVVRLEQNYRSTKNIVAAADALIRNNTQRKAKRLFTDNEAGEAVEVLSCADEKHEARLAVEWFTKLHDQEKLAWRDMAVFYRVNSLSRVMEEAMRAATIPYQIARGTAFYDRAEIKDAVAYLRAVANPADTLNLLRIINTPARGISDATVKAIQLHSLTSRTPLLDVLQRPGQITTLNKRAVTAVEGFWKMIEDWRDLCDKPVDSGALEGGVTLRGFVQQVLRDSGLEEHYRNDKSDPDQERLLNLGELVSAVQQFEEEWEVLREEGAAAGSPTYPPAKPGAETAANNDTLGVRLRGYLERVSLMSDVDAVDASQGAVTLMTLHAAKGLEFAAVAMIGLEDGLLPHSQSNQDLNEIEEERRLCFVGITRARRVLRMSHAKYRTIFGQTQPTIPSRFLRELPEEATQWEDRSEEEDWLSPTSREGRIEARRSNGAARPSGEYGPGMLVRHPTFGVGRVLTVSAVGSHTRAQVQFHGSGVKTLVLEYARLEKVSP